MGCLVLQKYVKSLQSNCLTGKGNRKQGEEMVRCSSSLHPLAQGEGEGGGDSNGDCWYCLFCLCIDDPISRIRYTHISVLLLFFWSSKDNQMSISNWASSPTACFLSWLFKLFKLFTSTLESSIKVPGLVTPGILGRWQGGVWAIGELRRSNKNFRS